MKKIFVILLCALLCTPFCQAQKRASIDRSSTTIKKNTGNRKTTRSTSTSNRKTTAANTHKAVDLGLSVLWATCNIGAGSPEQYGGLYRYGDPYHKIKGWDTEMCPNYDIVNTDKDIAKALWKGKWRMPTMQEMQELIDYCTFEKQTIKGVVGYKVTGPNGNSIFLPAAGTMYNFGRSQANDLGNYISGEITSKGESRSLFFSSPFNGDVSELNYDRGSGYSVRAVMDIFPSRTTKKKQRLSNIEGLQKAIVRIVAAAPNFSQDTESLWAFEIAGGIAKSITLQPDKAAGDLASAYKALSYVAYGLNYGVYPMMGVYGINPLEYNVKATDCIVNGNDKIGTFCKDLHLMELKSDQGFALFLEDPNTGDSIVVAAMGNLESTYKDTGDAFKSFQLHNRAFFFAYCQAIAHLTNEDDAEMVSKKLGDIAKQLDSMPKETSTDEEYYEVFNKIIGVRAQMINLLAMNLEHNKRVWPQ